MLREQAVEYRTAAAALILETPKTARRAALTELQTDADYLVAKRHSQAARHRAFITRGFLANSTNIPTSANTKEVDKSQEGPDLIEWANQVADTYLSYPKSTRKEKERATKYLKESTATLLSNPEHIPAAVSVWKNSDRKDPAFEKFYSDAKLAVEENARILWRNTPEDKLGELVKVAAHDKSTADFSEAALRGFFKGGGQSSSDAVEAKHKFTSGMVSLGPDYQSLKLGYDIAVYKTPEILPLSSNAGINYLIGAGVRLDNKADIRKATTLSVVWRMISKYISEDYETDSAAYSSKFSSVAPQQRIMSETAQVIKKLGHAKTLQFIRELYEITSDPLVDIDQDNSKGPLQEYLGYEPDKQPLLLKTHEVLNSAGGYYTEAIMHNDSKTKFPDHPLKVQYFPVGNQDLGYTIVPISLKGREFAAVEDEVITAGANGYEAKTISTSLGVKLAYNGGRPLSPVRGRDFASLATIGIPILTINGELPTLATTGKLSAELYEKQRIFLDKRGVEVDLKGLDTFTAQGFRSLIFKRADSGIDVVVKGDNFTANTGFDKYFSPQRSKEFSSPLGEESLYMLMLKTLKGILAREAHNGGTEESSQFKEVIARMAHLRLLPAGQNSSEEARRLYKVEQHLDLAAKSAQIKVLNESDPIKADRNTTYVQAVKKEGYDQLPPVELNILNVLGDSFDTP